MRRPVILLSDVFPAVMRQILVGIMASCRVPFPTIGIVSRGGHDDKIIVGSD